MSYDSKTALIDTIFRLFPNARIIGNIRLEPSAKSNHEKSKLLPLKPPARRRARGERASAGRQKRPADSYSLFEPDDQRGGI